MLTIRHEQMQAFETYMARQFEERLSASLRSRFHKKTADLNDEQLRASIRAGAELAAAYGITVERDVARFVTLQYRLGAAFDIDPRCPWAGSTLRRADLSGTAKMDALEGHASNLDVDNWP